MPIVFAAPEPFSGAISSAYGAAEQGSRALPVIAGLYGQAAQIAARANESAADNAYRNAASLGQQRLQGSEFVAQQESQARQFDLSRQVAVEHANAQRFQQSLQAAEFQRAPEMQQRQFELRAELNQAQLSQQENLRLKQLQEYQGAIDADNNLSDEEKADLKLQVQAKVSPLAHRKAKAEVMLAEQHAKQYEQQALQREEVTRKNAALDAKSMAERTSYVDLPDGSQVAMVQTGYDQNGRPTYTQVENKHAAAKEKAAAELEIVRQKDYEAAVQRAERSVERWAAARDKKAAEAGQAPLTAEEYHQNVIDELGKFGLAPTWEQQRARRAGGAEGGGGPGGPGPGSGQIPPPAEKPFDEDAQASPRQREQLSGFKASVQSVRGSGLPQGAKDEYARAARAVEGLLREYGSVSPRAMAGMSARDQADLTAARLTIERIEAQAAASAPGGRVPGPGELAARVTDAAGATGQAIDDTAGFFRRVGETVKGFQRK